MESQKPIEILKILNPYVIWARNINSNEAYFQIELLGVVPQYQYYTEEFQLINSTCNKWSTQCIQILELILTNASNIYFLPCYKRDKGYSMIDGTDTFCGKIFVRNSKNEEKDLVNLLCSTGLAKICMTTFDKNVKDETFKSKSDKESLEEIKLYLKRKMDGASDSFSENKVHVNDTKAQCRKESNCKQSSSKYLNEESSPKVEFPNDKNNYTRLNRLLELSKLSSNLSKTPVPKGKCINNPSKVQDYSLEEKSNSRSPTKCDNNVLMLPAGYPVNHFHTTQQPKTNKDKRFKKSNFRKSPKTNYHRGNSTKNHTEDSSKTVSPNQKLLTQVEKEHNANTLLDLRKTFTSSKEYTNNQVEKTIKSDVIANVEKSSKETQRKMNISPFTNSHKVPILKREDAKIEHPNNERAIRKNVVKRKPISVSEYNASQNYPSGNSPEKRKPISVSEYTASQNYPSGNSPEKRKPISVSEYNTSQNEDPSANSSDDPDLSNSDGERENCTELKMHKPVFAGINSSPGGSVFSNYLTQSITKKNTSLDFNDLADIKEQIYHEDISNNNDSDISSSNLPKSSLGEPLIHLDNFIENIAVPRILVQTKNGHFSDRFYKLNDAQFSTAIFDNLKKTFQKPTSLQTAVWPIAMKRHSVFIIGSKGSGKTYGILVPLCNFLSDLKSFENLPKSNGPLALILCANSQKAKQTETYCNNLLNNAKSADGKPVRILMINNTDSDHAISSKLCNGCEILIAMPHILKLALDLSRLSYVVFDDVEELEDDYGCGIDTICNASLKIFEDTVNKGIRIFAASKIWCDSYRKLAAIIENSVLCVSALEESMVFSNIKIAAYVQSNDQKIDRLMTILEESNSKHRIVVICDSDKEINAISARINESCYEILSITSKMGLGKNSEIKNKWKTFSNWTRKLILVCSDANLSYLDVTEAEQLIHYSLPRVSFTTFYKRFSTIIDSIPNIWHECDSTKASEKCIVQILMDETNAVQFPRLTDYIERCGVVVPDYWKADKNNILEMKEQTNVQMCEKLMSFGHCPNKANCNSRHYASEYDSELDWLPKSGVITFKVLSIHSPSHFSARLIEHKALDGTVSNMNQHNAILNLSLEMLLHYLNNDNKKVLNLKKHINYHKDIFVVEMKQNVFYRCQIISVEKQRNIIDLVWVHLIDKEEIVKAMPNKIYLMPKKFRSMDTLTFKARLIGIVPNENDSVWAIQSTLEVKRLLSESEPILRGKIVIGAGKTLWLDSVNIVQNLKCNRVVVKSNIKNHLIDKKLARDNPNHLSSLLDILKTTPNLLNKPSREIQPRQQIQKHQPQWAHLGDDIFQEVYMRIDQGVDRFFVSIFQYDKQLACLIKEINQYAIDLKNNLKCSNETYNVGDYCIAKYLDEYNRARIDRIEEENNRKRFTCFYVDYGDYSVVNQDSIYPIIPMFITRLPFQAIECRLVGVKPVAGNWTVNAADYLYNLSFQSNESNVLKVLLAKPYLKETAELTKGFKYAIVLFDTYDYSSDSPSLINYKLVEENFAIKVTSEERIIENANVDVIKYIQNDRANFADASDNMNDLTDDDEETGGEVVPCVELEEDFQNIDDNSGNLSDEDESDWEICDAEELIATLKKQETKNCATLTEVPNDFVPSNFYPPIKTLNESSEIKPLHKTPAIKWHQTEEFVYVKIDIIGVEDYKVTFEDKSLHFETNAQGEVYKLELRLYAVVDVEQCSHSAKGLYVLVKLSKLLKRNWLDLVALSHESKLIKYDAEFIDLDDEETEETDQKEQIRQLVNRLDTDESDDDDD